MNEYLIEVARIEWADQGCIATDTAIALNNAGIDPDALTEQFEQEAIDG